MSQLKDIPYEKYKRACQLATDSGFFQAYFDALPVNRTIIETFLAVNEEYLEHFGEDRYVSYDAFRMHLSRYLKKRKSKK
jgi:3',5'-cyclic AMP phosphodiesterase CpdA